jgi:hypothetical protein
MRSSAFVVLALTGLALAGTAGAQSGVPAGSYQTTIKLADARGRMQSTPADSMTGTWTLAFDDKNHLIVKRGETQIADASVHPRAGGRLYFDGKDVGNGACKSTATYRFAVKGNQLTFRKVGTDKCDGRVVVLTSHPFTRTTS